tara:strand:+ start:147 stop:476 length:330 start_codon:yes stop_codon:yes gene_type:complete
MSTLNEYIQDYNTHIEIKETITTHVRVGDSDSLLIELVEYCVNHDNKNFVFSLYDEMETNVNFFIHHVSGPYFELRVDDKSKGIFTKALEMHSYIESNVCRIFKEKNNN